MVKSTSFVANEVRGFGLGSKPLTHYALKRMFVEQPAREVVASSSLYSQAALQKGESMPSLRVRQKIARRGQMLEAARELFVANGYGKTSIEAIAEAAEVGVATVYTYFESKEGLTAELIHKDIAEMLREVADLNESLPVDPPEAIILVLDILKDFNKYITRDLLREFIIQAKVDGPVSEALAWGHQAQIDAIAQILVRGKAAGKLAATLDEDLAAALIVDLMDRHMSRLTTASKPEKFSGQLAAFIRLLFQEWRSSPS
jgi:AcrR family transcriptional regulator